MAKPVYDKSEWVDFKASKFPERKMRECISDFYLLVLDAPPPEDWKGEGGTISEIISALRLKDSQRQRVMNVIAATHRAHFRGEDYCSMRAYQAGTRATDGC